MNPPPDSLAAAMAEHRIELPQQQVGLLRQYCVLLWDWNTKINLTRHTDYQKFVARDLVDSLAFAEVLRPGERILDVGTGGGVPGIVLAVVRPDLSVSLSESVGKKARAVADIVDQLGLDVPVYAGRAQDLLKDPGPRSKKALSPRAHGAHKSQPQTVNQRKWNSLVARAVGRLARLLNWFAPHWESFDRLLVLKGPGWIEERGEARHQGLLRGLALRNLTSYPLPGTESESVLLQVCPKDRMLDAKTCRISELPAMRGEKQRGGREHPRQG